MSKAIRTLTIIGAGALFIAAGVANARAARAGEVTAENSPGNVCRKPDVIRGVIEHMNDMPSLTNAGLQVVNITHLKTLAPFPDLACKGTFWISDGQRFVGIWRQTTNAAGDGMEIWTPVPH